MSSSRRRAVSPAGRRQLLRSLVGLSLGGLAARVAAQASPSWPAGPIRIVQPTETGTSVDRLVRGMQPFLAAELGVPIVIENRPGGLGTVGTRYVLDAPADGNTIIAVPEPVWLPARRLLKSPAAAWAPLGAVNSDVDGIMAPTGGFKTLLEVLQAAKAGKSMTFGAVPGIGGYVGYRYMMKVLGLPSPKYVMYASGGPLRIDLIGGHVDLSIATHDGWLQLHHAGKARMLAFFSEKRSGAAPEVPTVKEVVREFAGQSAADQIPNMSTLRSFLVTRATQEKHPDRYARLVAAIKSVSENPDFLKWAQKSDFAIAFIPPDAHRAEMETLDKLGEGDPEAYGAR